MKTATLSELCKISSGGTPSRKQSSFFDGEIPWAKISDIEASNGTLIKTEERITQAGLDNIRNKIFPKGTLLFAIYGSIGKMAFAGCKLSTNQAILGIQNEFPNILNDRFLFRWLEYKNNDFLTDGRGIAQKNLSATYLRTLKIPLPPLAEQKRIAAILDQADRLRRQRQAALDRLSQLGQSIFYDMFGEWNNTSDKWEMVELGDKLDFLTSGSRGWAKYYSDTGAKFIRIQNVKPGHFDSSDLAYVNAPISAEAKRTKVQPGDVLMSITADLGRAAVVPDDLGLAHINQHLVILRSKSFNPHFLAHALTTPFSQRNIERKNNGGTKAGLNFSDVRTLKIIYPPKKQQDKFANRLSTYEQFGIKFKKSLDFSNTLFSSLQQRAFRGEL